MRKKLIKRLKKAKEWKTDKQGQGQGKYKNKKEKLSKKDVEIQKDENSKKSFKKPKEKKEKVGHEKMTIGEKDKVPHRGDKVKVTKTSKGKSHAYGKNKGELKGKEFGQTRASEARQKHKVKKAKTKEKIVEGEKRAKDSGSRIQHAKVKLDADKKAGKVTAQEYKNKKQKINKAEQKLKELNESVIKAKKKID